MKLKAFYISIIVAWVICVTTIFWANLTEEWLAEPVGMGSERYNLYVKPPTTELSNDIATSKCDTETVSLKKEPMPTIKVHREHVITHIPKEVVTESEEVLTESTLYLPTGDRLTKSKGVFYGPSGKETYYNLDMSNVVSTMRSLGFSAEEFPFWIREDGAKMLGGFVIVAADLKVYPKGTIIECSLGPAMVCDTGGFVHNTDVILDIAVNW